MKIIQYIVILLACLLLFACSSNNNENNANTKNTDYSNFNLITNEDFGFDYSIYNGEQVLQLSSVEDINSLWSKYDIKAEKPTFEKDYLYYIVAYGTNGCMQEVYDVRIEGEILNVDLTDISEKVCTEQYISKSTIIKIKKDSLNPTTFEIEGVSGEIKSFSSLNVY